MFGLLYEVRKYKTLSIGFPFFILLCIPVRLYLLPRIFNEDELTLLDGTPEEIESWLLKSDRSQRNEKQCWIQAAYESEWFEVA
jgi:hypothetical protein